MELASRQHGLAFVVAVTGRASGDDGLLLRDALAQALAQGHRRIVVDLGELEYLDSVALGELVAAQVRAIRADAPLKLANPHRRLQDLLILTRLTTVFDAYDSVADAVDSFDGTSRR